MVQYRASLDASFGAISDPTRRGILEQLGRSDASITDLAESFRMTLTGMKKHVSVLEQAGLVTTKKVGRVRTCRLGKRRLVPSRAVIERDGRPLVFVVKDGRAQWVYILPGRTNGIDTEVLPDSATGSIPVEVGDHVIVAGHLTLTHDAPVREVVADSAATAKTVKR